MKFSLAQRAYDAALSMWNDKKPADNVEAIMLHLMFDKAPLAANVTGIKLLPDDNGLTYDDNDDILFIDVDSITDITVSVVLGELTGLMLEPDGPVASKEQEAAQAASAAISTTIKGA